MGRKTCTGGYACHLCVLASLEKFEEIKPLPQNPQRICFIRGWVADSEKNLGTPMPVD